MKLNYLKQENQKLLTKIHQLEHKLTEGNDIKKQTDTIINSISNIQTDITNIKEVSINKINNINVDRSTELILKKLLQKELEISFDILPQQQREQQQEQEREQRYQQEQEQQQEQETPIITANINTNTNTNININTNTTKHIHSIKKHFETTRLKSITCMAVLSNGNIATGSYSSLSISDINPSTKTWKLLVKKDDAHSECINYLSELSKKKLASCSNDKSIKIWDISKPEKLHLLKTIKKHKSSISQVIPLTKERFASISEDKTIELWNERNYDRITTPFEHQENTPRCIIQLTKQNEMLCVSSVVDGDVYGDGSLLFYSSTAPYEQKATIEEVYTEYKYGMIELANGHIAVSGKKLMQYCVIIVNPAHYTTVIEIMDDGISQENYGCLCTLGVDSVLYVSYGHFCEVALSDGRYAIRYKNKEQNDELVGCGGLLIGDGKYFITNTSNANNGVSVSVYEFEYV